MQLFATPWTTAHQASLSFTISQSLLKLMYIELMILSDHLILCHLLPLLPSVFPSISPSNEYSGLISISIDWFDLLSVQGTLMNLLQHHNSKASILQCSVFFMVQLSHPYMTTGENIALTIPTFIGKVSSLLFKMMSRFVIAFLSRVSSVTQSCPAPCNPMDCSTPSLPVHHQLPELTQTHVH